MLRFRSLLLAATVGLTASLASCNSARYFDFTTASSRQSAYHVAAAKATPAAEVSSVAEPVAAPAVADPALTASTTSVSAPPAAPAPTVAARPAAPAAPRLSEQLTSARAERQLTRAQERRYERVLTRVKHEEARREMNVQDTNILEIILAIFLPPIGVVVHENGVTSHFWISLLLTLLFFLPGVIYSLLVVTDTI